MKNTKIIQLGLFCLSLVLVMSNCTNMTDLETEDNFVEGEIFFSPVDLIFIDDLLNSFEDYEDKLELDYLCTIVYLIENPSFDQAYYSEVIGAKEYLNNGDLVSTVRKLGSNMKFGIRFFEMNNDDLEDWVKVRDELKLLPNDMGFKHGILKVEPGTETEWLEILDSNPFIKDVQLNHNTTSRKEPE